MITLDCGQSFEERLSTEFTAGKNTSIERVSSLCLINFCLKKDMVSTVSVVIEGHSRLERHFD